MPRPVDGWYSSAAMRGLSEAGGLYIVSVIPSGCVMCCAITRSRVSPVTVSMTLPSVIMFMSL